MTKFNAGDKVKIDGQDAVILNYNEAADRVMYEFTRSDGGNTRYEVPVSRVDIEFVSDADGVVKPTEQ